MIRYHFWNLAQRFHAWREARKAVRRMDRLLRSNGFVETAPGRWER